MPKLPAGFESRTGATHAHRTGLVDRAELLRVPLEVPAHEGEVLVDPDEDAAAVELSVVATAHDDERLLVLASAPDPATSAPSSPQLCQSAQMNATAPGSSSSWASSTSGGSTARTLAGSVRYSTVKQVARVVPRRRWQDRRVAGLVRGKGRPWNVMVLFSPALGGSIEPDVDLTGPDGVLVRLSTSDPARGTRAAERVHHHLVVSEVTFGSDRHEFVHLAHDLGVVTAHQRVDDPVIPLSCLVGEDVLLAGAAS